MEVDKGAEPAPKPVGKTGAQGGGYVGALRGAPTVADEPETDYSASGPEPDYRSGGSASSGRGDGRSSTGTASIVIGATTAAVVSSLVVVGLLLYTQGSDSGKGSDGQRLNFVAPMPGEGAAGGTQPANSSNSIVRPDRAAPSPADTQILLQRADLHIRRGRLSEARETLEQAARLGSGVAALTLGAMYDPNRVAEFGNLGVQADPTLARAWYERAQALGVVEADSRLSELVRK
jgi:hypothetical protein